MKVTSAFLGEHLLPFQDWCFFEARISAVAAVGISSSSRRLRGTSGHQRLHAWGVQTSHALALIQPQLASRVLDALPLLKEARGTFQERHKDNFQQKVSLESSKTSNTEILNIKYLSRLLAWGLVLCSLAQVLHPLVFWQEILLLGHFLPISSLVQRLPERTGKDVHNNRGHGEGRHQKTMSGMRTAKRSINKTYPRSTKKESLHILPFLFNWNLENNQTDMVVVKCKHAGKLFIGSESLLSRLRHHCVSAEFKSAVRKYWCVFTDWLAGLFPAVWGQTCHPFLKEYRYRPYPAELVPSQYLTLYEGYCREEKQSPTSHNTGRRF